MNDYLFFKNELKRIRGSKRKKAKYINQQCADINKRIAFLDRCHIKAISEIVKLKVVIKILKKIHVKKNIEIENRLTKLK